MSNKYAQPEQYYVMVSLWRRTLEWICEQCHSSCIHTKGTQFVSCLIYKDSILITSSSGFCGVNSRCVENCGLMQHIWSGEFTIQTRLVFNIIFLSWIWSCSAHFSIQQSNPIDGNRKIDQAVATLTMPVAFNSILNLGIHFEPNA